jgi:hypothetical protein
LEPIAELRKLTASLLTPTTRSVIARANNATNITIYTSSITGYILPYKCGDFLFKNITTKVTKTLSVTVLTKLCNPK